MLIARQAMELIGGGSMGQRAGGNTQARGQRSKIRLIILGGTIQGEPSLRSMT